MTAKLKFEINDAGARAKLKALISATGDMQPVYATVGRSIANRIRLCFKLGIDPWSNPWQKIKWRSPRVQMQKVKDAAGNVVDYKRKIGKDGKPILTKYGRKQVEANKAGTPGQPLRDTGRLNRSIVANPDKTGVTIGTNVKYARTHQFGATIRPRAKKVLAFPGPNGQMIFAKKVAIPARPFLPLKKGQNVVALPPAWSADVTRALRAYFRNVAKGTA